MAAHLLLVDDHELTRLGIKLLIASRSDWSVCGEASNGHDAIAKVKQLRPDVVVLDLSMTGMNGFEAAAEIRLIAPLTKIVFCTMHDVPAVAKRVGGDEFVSKAASPRELIAAIERALAKRPPAIAAASVKSKSADTGQ